MDFGLSQAEQGDPFVDSTPLAPGLDYYYHVTAVDGNEESGDEESRFSATADVEAPPVPTGLTVSVIWANGTPQSILVDWSKVSSPGYGYKVYRKREGESWDNGTDLGDVSSYVDDDVGEDPDDLGRWYYYKVSAVQNGADADDENDIEGPTCEPRAVMFGDKPPGIANPRRWDWQHDNTYGTYTYGTDFFWDLIFPEVDYYKVGYKGAGEDPWTSSEKIPPSHFSGQLQAYVVIEFGNDLVGERPGYQSRITAYDAEDNEIAWASHADIKATDCALLPASRYVPANRHDLDSDDVPDFADGFNLNALPDDEDDEINASTPSFVPFALRVDSFDPEDKLSLSYCASEPAKTAFPSPYEPAPGTIRIWKKDGTQERSMNDDFIQPDQELADGWETEMEGSHPFRERTFYLEGIRKATDAAGSGVTVFHDTCSIGDWSTGFIEVVDAELDLTEPVPVNDDDSDDDGIIDYADESVEGQVLAPLTITLSKIDLDVARVKILYQASDPVNEDLPPGLRLWTRPVGATDDAERSFTAEGETGKSRFVTATHGAQEPEYFAAAELAALGFSPEQDTVTLYVERVSDVLDNDKIKVAVDPDGPGPDGYTVWDEVRVAGPLTTFVLVNDGDKDDDGIPDFADGYDRTGTDDDSNLKEHLAELELLLPKDIDGDDTTDLEEEMAVARWTFTYEASDPDELEAIGSGENEGYVPAEGFLRLWTEQGDQRDPAAANGGGDYVAPGTAESPEVYDAAQLGWESGDGRAITLYLEAVRPSEELSDLTIVMNVDHDGDGSDYVEVETKWVTALSATKPDAYSGAVCLADGTVSVTDADLVSGGYSGPWGHSRTYTNRYVFVASEVNGNHVVNERFLVRAGNGIMVVQGPAARYFDYDGTDYIPRFGVKARMEEDCGYALTEPDGSAWMFSSFEASRSGLERAFLQEYRDPAGNSTTVSRDGPRITTVKRGDESWLYQYREDERLGAVTLRRGSESDGWVIVSEAEYDYSDAGDLETVVTHYMPREKDEGGTTIGGVDTTLYRYGVGAEGETMLASVVGPESYQRIIGDNDGDEAAPLGLSNSELAPYADLTFTYEAGRVKTQWIRGAGGDVGGNTAGEYVYAYDPAEEYGEGEPGPATGFNAWAMKTTVTRPGDAEEIVYTNFAGQSMLSVTEAIWCSFTRYDEAGRAILTANPSAVLGYDDDAIDLLSLGANGNYAGLRDVDGRIEHYAYYSSEDSVDEHIYGYPKEIWLTRGDDSGTQARQKLFTYEYNAYHELVLPSGETVYRDEAGTQAITTTYVFHANEWIEDRPTKITTELPPVDGEEHGPKVVEHFDKYGRRKKLEDADGAVHTWYYDPETGSLEEEIIDRDGAHIRTYVPERDKFGRATRIQYHHYPPYYVETIEYEDEATHSQMIVTPDVGVPDLPATFTYYDRREGEEYAGTMSQDKSQVHSMTRTAYDHGGRVGRVDDYEDLANIELTEISTATVSFSTSYSYDVAGRLDQVNHADGTVSRTEYDSLDRVEEEKVGPNQSRLVVVRSNAYYGPEKDGALQLVTLHPRRREAYRITYGYDWRRRLTETTWPDRETTTSQVLDNLGQATLTEVMNNAICVARSGADYDNRGRMSASREYDVTHAEQCLTTTYAYDKVGRLASTTGPDGVTRSTDYNGAGMVTGEYTKVAEQYRSYLKYEYANGRLVQTRQGTNEGDAVVVSSTRYTNWDTDKDEYRVTGVSSINATEDSGDDWTKYWYNDAGWREKTVAPDETSTEVTQFDALGRALVTETKDEYDDLLGRTKNTYDGPRLQQSKAYAAQDCACMLTSYFYDSYGRLNRTLNPDGTHGITTFNQLDEPLTEILSENADGSQWVEKTAYERDAAGRMLRTIQSQRTSLDESRTSYTDYWYDALGNVTVTVNHGVCASAPDRPSTPQPNSGVYIYAATQYDGYGRPAITQDNKGIQTKIEYNEKGQKWQVTEDVGGEDARVTQYTYNSDGLLATEVAVNDSGDQTTTYSYGDGGSGVPRNDLLIEVKYPDQESVYYGYYANGLKKTFTDQRGIIHTYTYDAMNRMLSDTVDLPPDSSVDDFVRRVEWTYDEYGHVEDVTSWSLPEEGTVLNQLHHYYDEWGSVMALDQSNLGDMDHPHAQSIEFYYERSGSYPEPTEYWRLNEVVYPDGRSVHYNYGTSPVAKTRVANIAADDAGTARYAEYTYDGASTVTALNFPGVGVDGLKLDYANGGSYQGWDKFGRIVHQEWVDGSSYVTADEFRYTYDANSNPTQRQVLLKTEYNETYVYDDLDRLVSFSRQGDPDAETIVKLTADDGDPYDCYGYAVAIDGNTAVIGAVYDEQGSVYIAQDMGAGWHQVAKFAPGSVGFGYAVDVDGAVAVVGAPGWDDTTGAAYVYRYDASSGWQYEAMLLADDGAEQDHFGHSVAVSGDRIVVGAPEKDGTCDATDAGAAYVFEYDGSWSQEVRLPTCSCSCSCSCSLDAYDYFGYSVDIDQDLVIVGAYGDDDDGEESGAAYIFRHSCSCWCEDPKLTPDGGHQYAQFGYDVAINVRYGSCGDFAVVGAPEHFSSTYNPGKAHVYRGGGYGCWVEEDTFEADPDHDNEDFGRAVAIDNTRIIIGASTEDTAAGHTGCAYVYEDDDEDGSWDFLKQLMAPQGADWDYFGHSVDVSGNSLIAGSFGDDDNGSSSGSAHLYVSIYAGRTVQSWDLDAVGNWTTTTVNGRLQHREHNAANEIQSLDGDESNVAYDAAGNMTTIPRIPLPGYTPGRFTARYDAWNRLRFICRDDGPSPGQWDAGDTTVAEYRYDGLGRRITKLVLDHVDGKWDRTDYFYNDRWQVLEERLARNLTTAQKETTLGSPHVQYVWDIRYLDSPICRFRDANDDWDADGDGQKDPGSDGLEETLYYLTDANHNVTAVVEPSGNVVERYLYDAYGRVHVLNGAADPDGAALAEWTLDPDNVSDVSNEILYAGYRHDPETLLYHVRHRYLHATLGRWLTSDPKGYVDGMSLYLYALANPLSLADALGLAARPNWQMTGVKHTSQDGITPEQARRYMDEAYNRSAYHWDNYQAWKAKASQQINVHAQVGDPSHLPIGASHYAQEELEANRFWYSIFREWDERLTKLLDERSPAARRVRKWLEDHPKAVYNAAYCGPRGPARYVIKAPHAEPPKADVIKERIGASFLQKVDDAFTYAVTGVSAGPLVRTELRFDPSSREWTAETGAAPTVILAEKPSADGKLEYVCPHSRSNAPSGVSGYWRRSASSAAQQRQYGLATEKIERINEKVLRDGRMQAGRRDGAGAGAALIVEKVGQGADQWGNGFNEAIFYGEGHGKYGTFTMRRPGSKYKLPWDEARWALKRWCNIDLDESRRMPGD